MGVPELRLEDWMLKEEQPLFCPKLEPFNTFRLARDMLSSQRSRSGQKAIRSNTNILVDFKEFYLSVMGSEGSQITTCVSHECLSVSPGASVSVFLTPHGLYPKHVWASSSCVRGPHAPLLCAPMWPHCLPTPGLFGAPQAASVPPHPDCLSISLAHFV